MRRYSLEVKLFALDRRRDSSGWGEIRRAIGEEFKIGPPTVRAMQRWEKEIDREAVNRALQQRAKKEIEASKGRAIAVAMEDLVPRLWRARDAGEDIEYRGWGWFFSIQESVLGTEKFRRFIEKYHSEREGQPEYPPTPPPWATKSVGMEDQQPLPPGWIQTTQSEEGRKQ